MTPRASRRLLFYALLLSLLLHLVLAGWFRSPFALPQEPRQIVTISHARIARISRATPPPRTPRPQPSPSASAPPKPAPKAVSRNGRGRPVAETPASAPPTPQPTPTPAALAARPCAAPNAPAALSATPQPAEIPPDARASAVSGETRVLVHLDATGAVLSAAVAGSSGNGSLDIAALTMAKTAGYAPAYKDCKGVPADYTFVAKWVAW